MLSVLCLLRESPSFTPDDVLALRRGIDVHTLLPFKFTVLTDSSFDFGPSIRKLPIKHPEWHPKHNKLELFRPDVVNDEDRFFYADLDTVFCGNLDPLFMLPGRLVMLQDFLYGPKFASGLMAWDASLGSYLYHKFAALSKRERDIGYKIGLGNGDQKFIQHTCGFRPVLWQEELPGRVASYKVHCKEGLPPGVSVVCFHGDPKPGDVEDEWVLECRA